MAEIDMTLRAGRCLKALIYRDYSTMQEFADDYGVDVSQIIRWCRKGIGKIYKVQEFAEWFGVDFLEFWTFSA